MVGMLWLSTSLCYSRHTRRKHTTPAGAADRIMYSWKLGNTENFKNWMLSMAESLFRADQCCKCTARLLAGIPCAAEAAHSFRWDAVMRSQLGEMGNLKHISTLKAANLKLIRGNLFWFGFGLGWVFFPTLMPRLAWGTCCYRMWRSAAQEAFPKAWRSASCKHLQGTVKINKINKSFGKNISLQTLEWKPDSSYWSEI